MADSDALVKVGDSRSVSNPSDECSSPSEESSHKLISDCSDLYDLINFHSSATTQIHHDDLIEEDLLHDEKDVDEVMSPPSKTNVNVWNSESNETNNIHRSRSSSASSSSSAAGSDHDSDSGHFSKTNGHHEPESVDMSLPENETTVTTPDVTDFKSGEMEPAFKDHHDDEERDELNEFSTLEAEIEKEAETSRQALIDVDSVVAPELHDANPDTFECVLPQHESSLVEETTVIHHQATTIDNSSIEEHVYAPDSHIVDDEVKFEKNSSSEDEEEVRGESLRSDEIDCQAMLPNEEVLPPVIVDVEMNHHNMQKSADQDIPRDCYQDSDKSNEIECDAMENSCTDLIVEEEKHDRMHVDFSSSSDSESDHGGKYGYQKKKKIDQFEKTSTTTSSTSAVVTTMVTKKKTAEMKIEQQLPASSNGMESPKGNANIKSSFNSTESETRYKEFNESEGVKIDRNKITRNFSQTSVGEEKSLICRICGKQVFHMESIKAEKSVFHKSCFRCKECSKPLSVDTYCSHEGVLYCRQHFRQLFQPKAKFDEDIIVIPRRRHELIIKENTPVELPPDVVRSADKPDYGLNEIPSLKNVKSRFEGNGSENGQDMSPSVVHVKRSESIASKMAKFQSNGSENGHHEEDSSSSEDENAEENTTIVKETRRKKEMPDLEYSSVVTPSDEEVVFSGMSDLKNQWEANASPNKEERAREKQEELAKLRARICHGKGNLIAKYENACEEALKSPNKSEAIFHLEREAQTISLKEKFEKGDVTNELESEKVEKMMREKEDDLSVFREQGTAIDARNIFKQIDANVGRNGISHSPRDNSVKRSPSMVTREIVNGKHNGEDIVRSTDKTEDEYYASVDLSSRFKFFENFQDQHDGNVERKRFTMTPPREIKKEETPEREIIRDPNIVRCGDKDDEIVVTDTARKMLNKFRELENQTEEIPVGLKPLKRITPPREFTKDTESPEPEIARDPNIIRACDKVEDEFLVEAHRAKSLKEKFEHWEGESDVDRENRRNTEELQSSVDTAKKLKAKFESLRDESSRPSEKPQVKVNRFI